MAAARIHFSGQQNKDIRTKFINFQKGETINPYRTENVRTGQTENVNNNNSDISNNNSTSTSTPPHDSQFELDPMRPPIVRLTQQSTNGDGRFLKARLRDPNIMKIVRLYLAFMNDQQPTVCVDGYTSTSIRMLLASEGLPVRTEHLLRIFQEVYQEYGLSSSEAKADLQTYRTFLLSERTHRLQQLRVSHVNFHK